MHLVNVIPCRTDKVKNIVKAFFNYYTTFLITDYKNTKIKVGNSNKKLHSSSVNTHTNLILENVSQRV